jgi:hypothetical protein
MASTISAPQSTARDLALGFVAGAIAVLVVHQVMVIILTQIGLIQGTPYSTRPVPPFGVPTILNQMFWGGLWGMVFAALVDRMPRHWPLVLIGLLFGLLGPVLFGWFVVAPIKGLPMAAGWNPVRMLNPILINGPFGIGAVFIFVYLRSWLTGLPPRMSR